MPVRDEALDRDDRVHEYRTHHSIMPWPEFLANTPARDAFAATSERHSFGWPLIAREGSGKLCQRTAPRSDSSDNGGLVGGRALSVKAIPCRQRTPNVAADPVSVRLAPRQHLSERAGNAKWSAMFARNSARQVYYPASMDAIAAG